jgi:hypothetical protein
VSDPTYTLTRHAEDLAVVALPAGAEIPVWAESSSLFSVTATAIETTMICSLRTVPDKYKHPGAFVAFELADHLDLEQTGVISHLTGALAGAGISVFVLSTFATDWFLVPGRHADAAAEAWRGLGHQVVAASPEGSRA